METYRLYVWGMHCNACVVLTEEELKEVEGVTGVKADLQSLTVVVTGDFGEKGKEEVRELLSKTLEPHGYSLHWEPQATSSSRSKVWLYALLSSLGFIGIFIYLQKAGLVNFIGSGELGWGNIFIVGLIASVSSCMAVVGGLVLSVSASLSKAGEKVRTQIYFHIARLLAFFFLGGIVGAAGSAFALSANATFVLSLLIGLVLLVLGINLLDVLPHARKLQLTLPKSLGRKIHSLKNLESWFAPLLLGIATFFLPCGFTQSMQLYALGTGSFRDGALTMLVFALGTLPVLAVLSFTSFQIRDKKKMDVFYKAAGIIVIFFAIFNLLNSLAAKGYIGPVFNF